MTAPINDCESAGLVWLAAQKAEGEPDRRPGPGSETGLVPTGRAARN